MPFLTFIVEDNDIDDEVDGTLGTVFLNVVLDFDIISASDCGDVSLNIGDGSGLCILKGVDCEAYAPNGVFTTCLNLAYLVPVLSASIFLMLIDGVLFFKTESFNRSIVPVIGVDVVTAAKLT